MVNVPIQIALALAPVVPEILRWITGDDKSKAAEVAEQVVDVAERVTGKFGMEAAEAVRADPKLMIQFRTRVLEIDADLDKAYLADRQDARKRDVALAQAGHDNRRKDVMIIGAVIGLLACLWVLVFFRNQIPGEVVGILSTISGLFGACLRDAFQFEFGSSRGSASKSQDLQVVIDRLTPPRTP